MKHCPLPNKSTKGQPPFAWAAFVALAGALVLLILLGVPIAATGHAPMNVPDTTDSVFDPLASVPDPVSVSEVMQGEAPEVLPATETLTHTAFLPLIFKDYWLAPDSLLGVQLYGNKDQEAVLKTAQMGARWARQPISWAWIEPVNSTPEDYHWPGGFDDWLARLSAKRIQIILNLAGNPSWAATYSAGRIDRTDIGELAEFMAAAVAHYGAPPYNVKYWEFYNEPDNGSEYYAEHGWGYWGNEPGAYAEMLAAVYPAMKTVDPEAQIVFGGLAYDWWESEGGHFVEEFLDGVLLNGGGDYFDVMNFHYFPIFRPNWEEYGTGIIGKATYIRDKLASYGVQKPLICTETSMWSDEAHGGSDELQSRYVPQVFARSMATDLKTTIWLMLIDGGGVGTWEYGLLNPDLSPKPAYFAYKTLAQQLAPAGYVRTLGPVETGSDQLEAYEFLTENGATRIIVAWTEDEQDQNMWLAADEVVVVDKYGDQTTIYDGDDGVVDGRVWVTVGPSPVYLRLSN